MYLGGPPPLDLDAADVNDDGRRDIADADYLFNYLFIGGPAPPAPFFSPGTDPTPDVVMPEVSSALSLFSPDGNSFSKPAGATFQIPIEVRLDVDAQDAPVDAYSVAVETSGGAFLNPQIGVTANGQEFTEVLGGGSAAIAEVIMSFVSPTPALAPGDNPHTLLRLTLEGTAPAVGGTAQWQLAFQDGLIGSGQPVENIVSVAGTPFAPTTSGLTIEVMGVPEPSSFLLAALGLLGLAWYAWRRRCAS